MESISELVSATFLAVAAGLMGILVHRRRKHLKLVVRVLDQKDHKMIAYLDHLVQSGQVTAASPA
jgi:hypothetical protein